MASLLHVVCEEGYIVKDGDEADPFGVCAYASPV